VNVTVTGANRPTHVGTAGADTLTANGSGKRLIGLDGDDKLTGHGAKQLMVGGRGNDTITVHGAKSVIYGGSGTNTITLRGSHETVVLQQGGVDDVFGFNLHNGDVLNLKQVFAEAQIDIRGEISKIAGYVQVSASGSDATLSFNPDGLASGPGSTLAVLHGVAPGVTLSTLIGDGSVTIS
jgi:Ca2+-binding RTX toxin-like protein